MPKASLAIGTMRRPSASVTSSRASGMSGGEVYQNARGERRVVDERQVQAEEMVVAREEQCHERDDDDDDEHQPQRRALAPNLRRLTQRLPGAGPAPVAD